MRHELGTRTVPTSIRSTTGCRSISIRIGRIVDRVGDQKWQRLYGLSASEIRVLFALRRSGGDYARRPTDLFKALLVTSGAITKKVDPAVRPPGFVKRRADPGDPAAACLVHLTAKGKQVADQALESLADDSIPLSPQQILAVAPGAQGHDQAL